MTHVWYWHPRFTDEKPRKRGKYRRRLMCWSKKK